MLNPILLDNLNHYVATGRDPGDFLQAVLANDLKESFIRADDENSAAMREIVQHIYWNVPRVAWGSWDIVRTWRGTHATVVAG